MERRSKGASRCYIRSQSDAAVGANGVIYLRHGGTSEVYAYDSVRDSWSRLPDCPTVGCSLVVIGDGNLTSVGGHDQGYSSKLFSFLGDGRKHVTKKWSEIFPPMPTKRYGTTALCTPDQITLIVSGGWGEGGALATVEVMDIETQQWSSAARLPMATLGCSGTICDNHIYQHGGEIGKGHTKHLYLCRLDDLLKSRETMLNATSGLQDYTHEHEMKCSKVHSDKGTKYEDVEMLDSANSVWRRNSCHDLPAHISTLVTVNEQLLAIGGHVDTGTSTAAVHCYSPLSSAQGRPWEVLCLMPSARSYCFAAVVQGGRQLAVVGGIVGGAPSDSVYIATISTDI